MATPLRVDRGASRKLKNASALVMPRDIRKRSCTVPMGANTDADACDNAAARDSMNERTRL
eukprot:8012368-Alexandrium_andersonii.AAC.1